MTRNARRARSVGGALLALTPLAAAAGWIAYSRLAVDHDVPVPAAVEARRGTIGTSVGRLSYYASEAATGRPLVLIHAINAAASAYEMSPLFSHYMGQRPVFALDLPGFGFSDRPDIRYSPDVFKQAILEFLEQVVREPADIVALSLGSEFAALAASAAPERFNSLALISPTGFRENGSGGSPLGGLAYRVLTFPFGGRAFFDMLATMPSIRYFLSRSFNGPPDEGLAQYAYRSAHQPGAHHAPLYFITGQLFTPTIRQDAYARLPMPVLVIYDEDGFTNFETLQPFAGEHPNWRLARIQPTRGLPHFEQLGATTGALDAFWQGV